jgi:hypothetical protein
MPAFPSTLEMAESIVGESSTKSTGFIACAPSYLFVRFVVSLRRGRGKTSADRRRDFVCRVTGAHTQEAVYIVIQSSVLM